MALCFSIAPAISQEQQEGFRLGRILVKPSMELKMLATDNLYRSPNNKTRDTALVITPDISLIHKPSKNVEFVLDLGMAGAKYNSNSRDNYNDYDIEGRMNVQISSHSKFQFDLGYSAGHDDRGTGRTQTQGFRNATDPDQYSSRSIGGKWTYGLPQARARVELSAKSEDHSFDNNFALNDARDYRNTEVSALLAYTVSPKTSLFVEARRGSIDYDKRVGRSSGGNNSLDFSPGNNQLYNLDSQQNKYFIGAEWKATAKTTGSLRLGRMNRKFDEPIVNAGNGQSADVSGSVWEAAMVWSPKSYSTVNLTTGRNVSESSGFGFATTNDSTNLNWNHQWSDRFSSDVDVGWIQSEYGTTGREDATSKLGLKANYRMKRWLTMSAGINHIDSNSNDDASDFERNEAYLNARVQL